MSNAFEQIKAGLDDAINHAKGKSSNAIVHEPETIDVKAIREKIGMSQQRFCATFGISLGTLVTGSKAYVILVVQQESFLRLLQVIQKL